MDAGTRLTADQLAALAPGDAVTVESGAEFSRPRHTAGTVLRVTSSQVHVKIQAPRGAVYVECYSRRDGLRIGRGNRAALVVAHAADPGDAEHRRQLRHIDDLFRAWTRDRGNVERLRQLHDALGERLGLSQVR